MIVIDSRECRSPIPKMLNDLGIPTSITEMKVGDYVVGDIVIERKAIDDYIQSLTSGHLNEQLYELSFNYSFSYLFVEGIVNEALMKNNFRRRAFISSLIGSSFKHSIDGEKGQIVTVNLETAFDTALALASLHKKIGKEEQRLPVMVKPTWSKEDIQIFILSSFPNIGEKRAKLLLKKLGSLRKVFEAEIIRGVKGFTPALNRRFQEILDHEYEG